MEGRSASFHVGDDRAYHRGQIERLLVLIIARDLYTLHLVPQRCDTVLERDLRSTHPMHRIWSDWLRNIDPSVRSIYFMVKLLVKNVLLLCLLRKILLLKLQRAQLNEAWFALIAWGAEVDLLKNFPGALFFKSPDRLPSKAIPAVTLLFVFVGRHVRRLVSISWRASAPPCASHWQLAKRVLIARQNVGVVDQSVEEIFLHHFFLFDLTIFNLIRIKKFIKAL